MHLPPVQESIVNLLTGGKKQLLAGMYLMNDVVKMDSERIPPWSCHGCFCHGESAWVRKRAN